MSTDRTTDRKRKSRVTQAELPVDLDVLLDNDSVCAVLRITDRELQRRRAGGRFPQPDSPHGENPRWRKSTVKRYLDTWYPTKQGPQ
jgi:hypothetical protein